jgi:MoxR-like ATPase
MVLPALRHRIILNYEAQAENVSADQVLEHVLRSVAVPNKV